jgi:glycerol-3-phosphate dehydrogenase (NAD(P)+)
MPEQALRVLVLGHGEMGRAMEFLLAPRHALRVWQRRPPPDSAPPALDTAVADSDLILFCLPATAHAELAARLRPLLRPGTLCVTIAKGLDERGRTPAELLIETLGAARVAVLYGPMISEEIRAGRPAFAQCGAPDAAAAARVQALFRGTSLRLEPATDIAGLSWSAILKNVYAMAFGMADELGLGDNTRGFLAVAALHELAALVPRLGGASATPFRLAGLGDLITTATSSGSHHHELGRLIVRGAKDQLSGEGVHALAMLRAARRFDAAPYPLFRLIDACVQNPDRACHGLLEFLDREPA